MLDYDITINSDTLRRFVTAYVSAISVGIIALYLTLGCERDWVVIGGLCFDLAGALLLAGPDTKWYRRHSRLGRLESLRLRVTKNPKERVLPDSITDDQLFIDVMKDSFGGEPVSKSSVFEIKTLGGGNIPENDVLSHRKDWDSDGRLQSLSNIERDFQNYIREESDFVRSIGSKALILGFGLQILGLSFSQVPFLPSLC